MDSLTIQWLVQKLTVWESKPQTIIYLEEASALWIFLFSVTEHDVIQYVDTFCLSNDSLQFCLIKISEFFIFDLENNQRCCNPRVFSTVTYFFEE